MGAPAICLWSEAFCSKKTICERKIRAKLSPKCNLGFFVNVYVSDLLVKAKLRRNRHFWDLLSFRFRLKLIFNGSAWGTFTIASKSLFLKHEEDSTQHETLLIVSPGSLHRAQLNHIHSTQTCRSRSTSGLPWRRLAEEANTEEVHKQCS